MLCARTYSCSASLTSRATVTAGHRQAVLSCRVGPAGSRLLVSASNSVHYLFDTLVPWQGPLAQFTGHVMGSFYIKTAFSGDGTHILSGSSDAAACIWAVAPGTSPLDCLVPAATCDDHLHAASSADAGQLASGHWTAPDVLLCC